MTQPPNIPNLPGMGNPPTLQAQLSTVTGRVLQYSLRATDGLTVEQLCDTRGGVTNSIGWDVWHVVRTIDNIIHFVFDREQPVWLQHNFHEQWGLPKVDQGTGMSLEDARAMKFRLADLRDYGAKVSVATIEFLENVPLETLDEVQMVRPLGEMPRWKVLRQVVMTHGFMHLGEINGTKGQLGLGFSI